MRPQLKRSQRECLMTTTLSYVIRFVADMGAATQRYRDDFGFILRFESPHWTEFDTGATTFALHPATEQSPAGTCQLGLRVDNLDAFHRRLTAEGYVFTRPPQLEHGLRIARFRDKDGAEISVSEPRR